MDNETVSARTIADLRAQVAEKDKTLQSLRFERFGLSRRLSNADSALEIQTKTWEFERARAEKAEAELVTAREERDELMSAIVETQSLFQYYPVLPLGPIDPRSFEHLASRITFFLNTYKANVDTLRLIAEQRDGLAAALLLVFQKSNEWIRTFESIDEDDFKPEVHAKLHAIYAMPDNWDAEEQAESILLARDARVAAEARRGALMDAAGRARRQFDKQLHAEQLEAMAQEDRNAD